LAIAESLRHLADRDDNPRARVLGNTLDAATEKVLTEDRSPARRLGQIDNRGSHFYLALYWAQALAAQDEDPELAQRFVRVAEELSTKEAQIAAELLDVQGSPVDLGGYYHPDEEKTFAAMRPSATFNAVIDDL